MTEHPELFRRSLASARELKAPGWELGARHYLLAVPRRSGQEAEAVLLLTEARGKFRAGESSFDLREAEPRSITELGPPAACPGN